MEPTCCPPPSRTQLALAAAHAAGWHPPTLHPLACLAGRYSRYRQQVGSGRFKVVFKGFDEKQGIDVAWSKIQADTNGLSHEQVGCGRTFSGSRLAQAA